MDDFDDPRGVEDPDPRNAFDGHPQDVPNGYWNMLRAAVLDERVGGADDGLDRYPNTGPLPELGTATLLGRCLVDSRPWDDHTAIGQVGLAGCPGLAAFG